MRTVTALLHRKLLLAVVAAAIVGSVAYAFAASLGITSDKLSAGNAPVASCGSGINVTYTTSWDNTAHAFTVDSFSFDSIPATCLSKNADVVFADTANAQLGATQSVAIPASGTTGGPYTVSGAAINAEDVENINVSVTG